MQGFYWNDSWLKAAAEAAYKISVAEAAALARAKAPWRHIQSSISPTPDGIRVGAPDAKLAEEGAGPHMIEEGSEYARFPDGGVRKGPIKHPGFKGTEFIKPATEAWPELFVQAAKGTFPG